MKIDSPNCVMVCFAKSYVMDDFILSRMRTAQVACENGGTWSAFLYMMMTTGSQGLVVRMHCVVKRRGRGGTGGRKGATYKKRATISPKNNGCKNKNNYNLKKGQS